VKCPHCEEELGLNNICINPVCSYFGTEIKFSTDSDRNNIKNDTQNYSNIKTTASNSFEYTHRYSDKNSQTYNNIDKQSTDNYFKGNNCISKEELTTFIGNNANYYLKYIGKIRTNNKFSSWNWPCFFLNSYWLLYRKLYLPAAILIGINFASSKILGHKTYLFFILMLRIIVTIFANSIYLNHCKQKITKIKASMSSLSEIQYSQYLRKLRKKGGVSLAAPIFLLIVSILVTIIYIIISLSTMSKAPGFYSGSYYL
jgi:hypothetical protein